MDLEGEISWVTNFTLGATAQATLVYLNVLKPCSCSLQKNYVLCSQCVPYHIPLCSLTTPRSALSLACDDLVIYVVTALGTLSFTISTGKLWSSGTSIALHPLHHALATPSLLVLTTATTMDIF